MRKDSENRKNRIIGFINTYTDTYGSTPSTRDIAAGTEEPKKLAPQSFENGYSDVIISVTFAYDFFWGLIGFF